MIVFPQIHTFFVRVAACAAIVLEVAGCHGLGKPPSIVLADAAKQPDQVPVTISSPADRALLTKEDWMRTVRGSDAVAPGKKVWRWRHVGVDELLDREAAKCPDFHLFLHDEDPAVAANAAIALARLGDADALDTLISVIRATTRPLALRCAAIEALGNIQPPPTDRLRELLEQYCRAKSPDGTPYIPELHAELLAALACRIEPAVEPRFQEALVSEAIPVRLEAIRAWRFSRQPLPDSLTRLRFHADPRVRAALLEVLGARRPRGADEWLIAAINDQDLQVRRAALTALGEYGGDRAHAALKRELESRHDAMRASAVMALDRLGDQDAVNAAAKDPSWEVRCAVVQCLGRRTDRAASAMALQFLDDPSFEVQRHLLAAIKPWPLQQSGPLLLAAMERPSYQTRKTAAERLAAQWAPASEFPVDAPPQRRNEVLQRLRAQFRQEVGFADPSAVANALPLAGRTGAAFSPQSLARMEELVQSLDSNDVAQRRRAANALADATANDQLLPRPVMASLVQRVATETDTLVWVAIFSAVAHDPSDEAIQLAYAGVGNPSPEVRRRACLHLASFPSPKHAKVLLPALDDSNYAVMVAAVQALGAARHLDNPEPLRRLLVTPNEALQLEIAVALTRIADPAGALALERLAYAKDPTIRRQTAAVMGEFANRQFIAPLIVLLDDRASVRDAALKSLRKIVGDEATRIEGSSSTDPQELVQHWKRWRREQWTVDSGQ